MDKDIEVDDYARQAFDAMGVDTPTPPSTKHLYWSVKRKVDAIRPQRLSPETLAIIATISVPKTRKAED